MFTKYVTVKIDSKGHVKSAKEEIPKIDVGLICMNFVIVVAFVTLSIYSIVGVATYKDKKFNDTFSGKQVVEKIRVHNRQGLRQLTGNSLVEAVEESYSHNEWFRATAYCSCSKCCGKWAEAQGDVVVGAAGIPLISGVSVAVDNSLYRFGTKFEDQNGNTYVAADTGSAIVGNRIDVYFESHKEAIQFGVRDILLSW